MLHVRQRFHEHEHDNANDGDVARVHGAAIAQVVGSTAPPTYDSIFGRIKGAKEEHGNSFGFVKALFTIVGAAIGGE